MISRIKQILRNFAGWLTAFKVSIAITLIFLFLTVGYDIGASYSGQFWAILPDIMIEIHGFVLDMILVASIIGYFQLRDLKKEAIKKERNLINEFRGIDTVEARQKIVVSIKELNYLGVSDIDLSECYLSGAVLTGVNLNDAILVNAKLIGATLVSAKMKGAVLFLAKLTGADLRNADLRGASLHNATLKPLTDLRGIKFDEETLFHDACFDISTKLDESLKKFLRDNYTLDSGGFATKKEF